MARYKTFANAGTISLEDLDAIDDDYESAFSVWHKLGESYMMLVSANDSGTRVIVRNSLGGTTYLPDPSGSTGSQPNIVFFARYLSVRSDLVVASPNRRTPRMRMKLAIYTNGASPSIGSVTFGLYVIAAITGTSGNAPRIGSLGAPVNGSQIFLPTPSPSTIYTLTSSEFAAPADGWYAVAISHATAVPSNAYADGTIDLQVRQA